MMVKYYLDGFQYVNGELQFFPHPEGYVWVTGNPQKTKYWYDYVYNYTDHASTLLSTSLGNIRLSYTKDHLTADLKILEENHTAMPANFNFKNVFLKSHLSIWAGTWCIQQIQI